MSWWSILPWQKKLAVGGIILVLLGLVALAILTSANSALRRASDDGAAIERGKAAEKSIERVEAANEVRAGIQYAPALWCDQCVRHSRTPANCRYQLPGVQDYQLCPAATGAGGRSGQHR